MVRSPDTGVPVSTTITAQSVADLERQGYTLGPEVSAKTSGADNIICEVGGKYYSDPRKAAPAAATRQE